MSSITDLVISVLGISNGSFVEIRFDSATADWAEDLAVAVEREGGTVFLNYTAESYDAKRIRQLASERLIQPSPLLWELASRTSAAIVIQRMAFPCANMPIDTFRALNASRAKLMQRLDENGAAYCLIAHPRAVPESELQVDFKRLEAAFEKAMHFGPVEAQRAANALTAALQESDNFSIVSGGGLNCLNFKLKGSIFRNDGHFKPGNIVNLPLGSIYFVPIPESVRGAVHVPRWRSVRGLRLTFESGRLTGVEAEKNLQEFTDLLEGNTGDTRMIGHIGIGLNYMVETLTGHTLLDGCAAGTVFFALGENRYLGGTNISTLNVDLLCTEVSLKTSKKELIHEGRACYAVKIST